MRDLGVWRRLVRERDRHKTQSGYVTYFAEKYVVAEPDGEGVGNVVDWRSHRLKRSVHCTLYAEAMSVRAAAVSGVWMRCLALECLVEGFRTIDAIDGTSDVPVRARELLPLHVVTDCDSLHKVVTLSSLPEDTRVDFCFSCPPYW